MTTYDDVNYSEAERVREIHPKGPAIRARAVDFIDLGHVPNIFKMDPETGQPEMIHKVRIVFETDRKRANGKPWHISTEAKLSLYDGSGGGNAAKLYTLLSNWLGETWDGKLRSREIVTTPALLAIIHKPKKSGIGHSAVIDNIYPDDTDAPYQLVPGAYKRWTQDAVSEHPPADMQSYGKTSKKQDAVPDYVHEQGSTAADDDESVPF